MSSQSVKEKFSCPACVCFGFELPKDKLGLSVIFTTVASFITLLSL